MDRNAWESCRRMRGELAPFQVVVTAIAIVLTIHVRAEIAAGTAASSSDASTTNASRYSYSRQHDPHGTGKFYMGREIAQVMGHTAIRWLERPQREREEEPTRLIAALQLRKGDVVADIGAGSGYLTTRLARAVGPDGRVKAVDVQPEMLARLKKKLRAARIQNVDLVLGEEADPKLPEQSLDLVLMVDVYHEFEYPFEMMQAVVRALKPDGRVVLVEYRKEDPKVPIKLVHKMTAAQATAEMNAVGLRLKQKIDTLPRQHILVFEHPDLSSQSASRIAE